MKNYVDILVSGGQNISDDEVITYIFYGLDSDYDPIVASITPRLESKYDKLTLQETQYLLQKHEQRLDRSLHYLNSNVSMSSLEQLLTLLLLSTSKRESPLQPMLPKLSLHLNNSKHSLLSLNLRICPWQIIVPILSLNLTKTASFNPTPIILSFNQPKTHREISVNTLPVLLELEVEVMEEEEPYAKSVTSLVI